MFRKKRKDKRKNQQKQIHTYLKYVWGYNLFTGQLEGRWVEVQ